MDIKILVAAHKKYRMPKDTMYYPIQVGASAAINSDGSKKDLGYYKDNTGDNISDKNPEYCELTAVYWAWKNISADYIGLVHYRRYFSVSKKGRDPFSNIMTSNEAEGILKSHSIIVPAKRHYYIESLYSHYAHTLDESHLIKTREIIQERYNEYLEAFDKVMARSWGYMFNMMVLRWDYFDSYCKWLFDILFELEKRIDTSSYSAFEKRLFGRVSELLFDVWLEYMIEKRFIDIKQIKEVPVISMESINWAKKISAFLNARLFHKKYQKSF